jgi:hypothetical protein
MIQKEEEEAEEATTVEDSNNWNKVYYRDLFSEYVYIS